MIIKNTPELFALFTETSDENIAYHVTTNSSQVDIARKNLSKKYQFELSNLCYMDQIHSNEVKIADPSQVFKCDALITNKLDTPLMVMVADCIPIIFFDLKKKAIAVTHAGRVGTFNNIASNTIQKLISTYQCDPKDIEVIFGPSIKMCCYEVSSEMAEFTKENFGKEFVQDRNIDLQGINKLQLLKAGIENTNITINDICTQCGDMPYFSYRNDKSCGRFAGLVFLK